MNNVKTISVEPAKITLGEQIRKESQSKFLRSHILESRHITISKKDVMTLCFPSTSNGMDLLSKYALPMRSVFAALLIISGIPYLSVSGLSLAFGIVSITFGAMLALGLLSRIAMGLSAVMYCAAGLFALRHGIYDILSFTLMFGSVLFFFLGSGKYSCDTFIRRSLIRKSLRNREKETEKALSYKALQYATKKF